MRTKEQILKMIEDGLTNGNTLENQLDLVCLLIQSENEESNS